jgi:HlyD family secretion protein
MNHTSHSPRSGAAMDKVVPRKRGTIITKMVVFGSVVLLVGFAIWYFIPRGLQIPAKDARIASVEKGVFLDNIAIRATAEPLFSVFLDSVESGRVEEVFGKDGQIVQKGTPLFRLSNPQRNLELLARQSEHAQQISNLSTLRVAQEASRTDHQRRLSDLEFNLVQIEKQHARNVKLSSQGYISSVALEESGDRLAQQRRIVKEQKEANETEVKVKNAALAQLEAATKGLEAGLQLVNATVEALTVRAPVAGRLTGFRLQVGETVKPDQHVGRIDDPTRFKLSAKVDEFYLSRVAIGHQGGVSQGEQNYPIAISAVYPQIKDGRFTVEMTFAKSQPAVLSPGQSLDVSVTLGEPAPANVLPNGAFINDTGGAWVFVLGSDGKTAERREIKIGRRNNSQVEILSGLAVGEKVIVSSYASFLKSNRLQLSK